MPRVGRISQEERELAAEIRNDFEGAYYLTLAQVGRVIGARSPHTVREWASTLVPRRRNGRKVYLVADVAHKMLSADGGDVAV